MSFFFLEKPILQKEILVMSEKRDAYWEDGDNYNRYITSELNSFRKNAWKNQICAHFPKRAKLKILDPGCGPGFFSCILSEEGHQLTGIDSSDGMLAWARKNAELLGVSPTLLHMDINALDFPDESFDAIVTRNVTWTLEYPENVYTELKRLLKPGGKLLIYDANWHLHLYDPEMYDRVLQRERRHLEKYGYEEKIAGDYSTYLESAPLTRIYRPDWDRRFLENNLQMRVTVSEDIGQHLYEQWEKELYAECPLFEICAVKA